MLVESTVLYMQYKNLGDYSGTLFPFIKTNQLKELSFTLHLDCKSILASSDKKEFKAKIRFLPTFPWNNIIFFKFDPSFSHKGEYNKAGLQNKTEKIHNFPIN